MSWGALQGLGDGLQQVGMAHMKSALDEKLTAAREARQDERDKAREQRAADRKRTTVDPKLTDYEQRDGVWFEILKGGEGNELEARLAPANKVREFRQQEEDRARSLEDDLLKRREASAKAGLAENKLRDYDSDRAFDMEQDRARTAAVANRGSGGRGSLDAGYEPSLDEETAFLLKEYDADFSELQELYPGQINPGQFRSFVRDNIQAARNEGISAPDRLSRAIAAWNTRLAKRKEERSGAESTTNSLSRSVK